MKVYLSSTYSDLKDYRESVYNTLCKIEDIQVVAMENYVACDERPVDKCLNDVQKCDAYIGLFAWRYGFIPDGYDHSITNLEFQKAYETKIPTFIFLLDDNVTWVDEYIDKPLDNILNFREDLKKKLVVSFFKNKEDLSNQVVVVISNHINKNKSIQKLTEDRRNQLKLIKKVSQTWIHDILDNSIYHQIQLEIGKEIRPEMLDNPWGQVLEIPNHEPQVLPKKVDLYKLFTKYENSLLILGEPGAGKTISLLTLARDLLDEAGHNSEHPVPFIVNLSSWALNQEPLIDWLQKELHEKYYIPPRISRPWLENQKMLPMLDGLDEVQAEHQKACAEAINCYVKDFGMSGLAVCCRIQEYESLKTELCLNAAIRLQALDEDQISSYFKELGLTGLSSALEQDPGFLELARTPLMLNIMAMTYENETFELFDSEDSLDTRRKKLFDSYIDKVFKRKREHDTSYSKEIVITGLNWLSGHLKKREQTIFLIENLQPSWLITKERIIYHFVFAAICLLCFLPLELTSISSHNMKYSNYIIFNLTFNYFFLFCLGIFIPEIKLANKMKWSWKSFRKKWLNSIMNMSIFMFFTGILFGININLLFVLFDIDFCSFFKSLNITDTFTKIVINSSRNLTFLNGINHITNNFLTEILMSLLVFCIIALPSGLILQSCFWIMSRQIRKIPQLKEWLGKKETGKSFLYLLKQQLLFWTVISFTPIIVGGVGNIWMETPGLIYRLTVWLTFVFLSTVVFGVICWGLFFGIFLIIIIGLPIGIILAGIEVVIPDSKQQSGYGIVMSLKNAIKYTSLVFIILASLGIILYIIIPNHGIFVYDNLLLVLNLLGILFLVFGGLAFFQHYALRFTLHLYHQVPFKLINFLDYATKLILMQKIGGGYIFIHRLLLEHFSSLQVCSKPKKAESFYSDLGTYLTKIKNCKEQNKVWLWGIIGVVITLITTVAITNYSNLKKYRPDTPSSLNELANLYKSQGKYNEAEALYKRSIEINENEFGKDHPVVAISLNNLANLFYSQEKYEKAEPLYKRSLMIRETKLEKNHPDLVTARNKLAELYKSQGKYEEAEHLLKINLELVETQFFKNSIESAKYLIKLGRLYWSQKKYKKADSFFNRIIEIYVKKFGNEHTEVAYLLNELALLYKSIERYDEAEQLLKRSLEIYGKAHGNSNVAIIFKNLGSLYKSKKEYKKAEHFYKRCIRIQEKEIGKENPSLIESINDFAELYKAQGKYDEAELLYKRFLKLKYKEYLNVINKFKKNYSSQETKTIVLIVRVVEKSQADSIGIQKGDIIMSYLGTKLNTAEELIEIVKSNTNNKQKKIKVMIVRNGEKEIEFNVKPGSIGVQIDTVYLSMF